MLEPTTAERPARWKTLGAFWLIKLGFLLAISVAIARDFDAATFTSALRAIGIAPLIACLGIDTLFFVVETFRLVFLSDGAYGFGLLLRSRYLSALIGVLLPGLAASDLVRVFLVDRERPGNKAGILVLLLGNRLYGVVSLVSLGIIALSQPAGAAFLQRAHGWGPVGALGVALLTAPLWMQWQPIQRLCASLLRGLPSFAAGPASRAYGALTAMTSFRHWLVAIVTCTFTNVLVVCEFWIVSRAVGAGVSFAEWCLFVPMVALATMLPLGIGAIGTQEAALLAASRLSGVRFEPLLLVSFAMHLVRIGGTLPGLAFFSDAIHTVQELRTRRSGWSLRGAERS
jgi:hypothetical protein